MHQCFVTMGLSLSLCFLEKPFFVDVLAGKICMSREDLDVTAKNCCSSKDELVKQVGACIQRTFDIVFQQQMFE